MSEISILRNVIVISLAETSLWTGRARMTAEDLGLDEDDVPPEAIASLGSKRVIDQKTLKPLNRIRYQMRRACMEVGTKFLAGFAVSVDEAEEVVARLVKLVNEGNVLKKTFLATLEKKIKEWHAQNPKWEHILSAGTPELTRIEKKITFGFHPYLVAAPESDSIAACFMGAVDNMANNLADEVVKEARLFVKQSLKDGRTQGSQKTVEPMRRLARKIESLQFINPALGELAKVMNAVLATIPKEGKVEAQGYINLCRVANLVADRSRFESTSRDLHEGKTTVEAVFADLVGDNELFDLATANALLAPLEAAPNEISAHQIFDQEPDCSVVGHDEEVSRAVREITGKATATRVAKPVPEPVKPAKSYQCVDF